MSSRNAPDISSSPFLPTQIPDKKTYVLNHLSTFKNVIDVRPASRLEVRPRPEMLSMGIAEMDALIGGLPRGCLSELCGAGSSGKTSVLLATIAAATRRQESCVLIDASDSFDPESGAAAGIEFGKFLWVRCGKSWVFGRQSLAKIKADGRKQTTDDLSADDEQPRTNDFFADERRTKADDLLVHDSRRKTHDGFAIKTHSERRLEQVLKTTDLVLQSGGFGLVALDLAGIPEKFVRRIPLASWFRFQRVVEHTKTALLVVSEFTCAQTCAAVVLRLSAGCPTLSPAFGEEWEHSPEPTHTQLLEGMRIEAELARTRLERKPMQSVKTNFATQAVRAG
jgi:recombination protein RecA